MRVGILTFHTADNYGAVLQTLGLLRAVRSLGHDAAVIDYRPASAHRHYRRLGLWTGEVLALAKKREVFRHFRRRYLTTGGPVYLDADALQKGLPDLDAVIVGSDQVWNVHSYRGFDPPFFTALANAGDHRRISYAASVGKTTDFGPHHDAVRSALTQFDHLAVRDQHSFALVQQATGRNASITVDPVFLADFNDVERRPANLPPRFTTAYCVEETPNFKATVRALTERRALPVVAIGARVNGATVNLPSISPARWLHCVNHGDFVLTNSFHGLAFAIKSGTPFAVLPREGGEQQRMDDLLERVGMVGRVVEGPDELTTLLKHDAERGFDGCLNRLADLTARSMHYLQEALA